MNKELIRKYKKEFDAWLNGQEVCVQDNNNWVTLNENTTLWEKAHDKAKFVIKDEHFEARKAYALGEEIEFFNRVLHSWKPVHCPNWIRGNKYRPKPKHCRKFKVGDKIRYIENILCEYSIKSIQKDRYILRNNNYILFTDENKYELVPKTKTKTIIMEEWLVYDLDMGSYTILKTTSPISDKKYYEINNVNLKYIKKLSEQTIEIKEE